MENDEQDSERVECGDYMNGGIEAYRTAKLEDCLTSGVGVEKRG